MTKGKLSENMSMQSVLVGTVLFIVLTVVAYIIFPVLYESQIRSIEHRLSDHVVSPAHSNVIDRIAGLELRIQALEFAAQDSTN